MRRIQFFILRIFQCAASDFFCQIWVSKIGPDPHAICSQIWAGPPNFGLSWIGLIQTWIKQAWIEMPGFKWPEIFNPIQSNIFKPQSNPIQLNWIENGVGLRILAIFTKTKILKIKTFCEFETNLYEHVNRIRTRTPMP